MSSERLPASHELNAWIESRRPLPPHVKYIEERNAAEPYRLVLSLLAADLAEASNDDMTARLLRRTPHQARIHVEDLLQPIDLILSTLPASLSQDGMENIRRQLNIFGLQAMRLDIREESSRYNSVVDETLRALNITNNFIGMPDQERLSLLV
jgi:phosphoenolpyruvate carboxylase